MAETTIGKIWAFFKSAYPEGLKAFKEDWDKLTETDREHIRAGIGNDTLTY